MCGLRSGVWALGLKVWSLGFTVWALGFGVLGLGSIVLKAFVLLFKSVLGAVYGFGYLKVRAYSWLKRFCM